MGGDRLNSEIKKAEFMDIFFQELIRGFKFGVLKKSFLLTWIFLLFAMILFTAAVFISSYVPAESVIRTIVQSMGLLLALSSLLAAFSAVYKTAMSPSENETLFSMVVFIGKKSYFIIGTVLILSAALYLIVFLQSALSLLAMIPYAGPVLMSLLAGIFYLCNILLILLFASVAALLPPIVLRSGSFADLRRNLLPVLKNHWLDVLLYLVISISSFILAMTIIYYIARYALGITAAIQWKINAAYPHAISTLSLGSFATDIIRKITPSPDPIGAFMDYGSRIFDYVDMIKVVVTLSYALVASILISFPLTIYLRITSLFYQRIDSGGA